MKLRTLIIRSFWFHSRGNFAVLLGVAIGAAVLTGALLVGDSLRGSLRDRALRGLGWVDAAMISPRFFRPPARNYPMADSVERAITLQATLKSGTGEQVSPAIVWAARDDLARRTLQSLPNVDFLTRFVMILAGGTSRSYWNWDQPFPRRIETGTVWLAERTANRLGAKVGDEVQILVPRRADVPRE